jgi:hypothetical protein
MGESTDGPQRDLTWVGAAVVLLALGSLGPANVYLAATDPDYIEKFSGWRILFLPFGAWLLTGFLVQGLTALWVGGLKRNPEWAKQMDRAWEWWLKLGLWLLGIGIALVLAALFFSGVASFLATLDRSTLLIAFLLLMILFALLRIGDQMKRP